MTENSSLYSGITKIAWAFVFILFHLRINTIDLLPDFVGYILIAIGIGSIADSLEHRKILKPMSIVISIWTASLWFTETVTLTSVFEGYFSTIMSYLSTAMGVVILIFTIILLTDLSVLAAKHQPEDKNIDRHLIVARNIYAVCYSVSIAMSLSALLTFNRYPAVLTGVFTGLSIASGIAILVTMVIILIALFSLRKVIKDSASKPDCKAYNIPPFSNEGTQPHEFPEAPENRETE